MVFKKYDAKGSVVDFFAKYHWESVEQQVTPMIYNVDGWYNCMLVGADSEEAHDKFLDWLISHGDTPMKIIGVHDLTDDQVNEIADSVKTFGATFRSKLPLKIIKNDGFNYF